MAISLSSNVSALAALRRLGYADSAIGDAFQRLSSGLRINRPSDDAAGLAVASTLGVQQRIFARAVINANDGISMLNLAQGSAQELSSVVIRMKELAQQAANGTLSTSQRSSLNNEAQKLSQEYNRLISSTRFNGLTIHGADQGQTNIQVGLGSAGSIGFELGDALESEAGNGLFNRGTNINEGVSVADVINVDFNNDGILDLVSISTANGKPIYRLGKGEGSFGAATQLNPTGTNYSLTAGDYDGDGWTDLIVGNNSGGVSVLHNVSGTLSQVGNFQFDPGTNGIDRMVMGDVNGDGNLDLIGTSNNLIGGMANVALGKGNGTFGATAVIGAVNGVRSTQVVTADFNADGRMDIAVNNSSTTAIFVYLSNSSKTGTTPSFQAVNLTGVGIANALATGDMNGDGVSDLIAGKTNSIKTFMGNGDGSFLAGSTTNIGTGIIDQLELRDSDLDGNLDLFSLDGTSRILSTLIANGDGTFQSKKTTALLTSNSRMSLADIDGDGVLDAVVAAAGGEEVVLGDTAQVTRILAFDIKTQSSALDALELLDSQLAKIGNELGRIGAAMSRIGSAINIAGETSENYASAGSRITDADVAQETASLTRNQILRQSATAVLAQANQTPALALQLLRF